LLENGWKPFSRLQKIDTGFAGIVVDLFCNQSASIARSAAA